MSRFPETSAKCIRAGGLVLAALLPLHGADAAGYKVLYAFQYSVGAGIEGGLLLDKAGNLFGAAAVGGAGNCSDGCGTIFELTPAGVATALYTFMDKKSDGLYPWSTLIEDKKGDLYGTTNYGGTGDDGTVFKLTTTKKETSLYSFTGGSDGSHPFAGLLADASGNFYGTTTYGGTSGVGTVFKLAPNGTETVLYSFMDGSDGAAPTGGVIADSAGNLYGAARYGGNSVCSNGCGVVYKIAATGGETVLLTFDGIHGNGPAASLIADAQGNFYGTTISGGLYNLGTVFKLAPNGTETLLYSFAGGKDGEYPYSSLVMDSKGNLYGTTEYGGASGDGTVFKLTVSGTETVLHTFKGGSDGENPLAGMIAGKLGELYGTTTIGGGGTGCSSGCGTIFEIKE